MSIWVETRIKELLARVASLDQRIDALETQKPEYVTGIQDDHIQFNAAPEPKDRRTKEWKLWKNANS